jgi:hypothetical protein
MKKSKYFISVGFTLAYAAAVGLLMECLLNIFSICCGASFDGRPLPEVYPRFLPFCMILGFLSWAFLIAIFVINIKESERIGYTKKIWTAQSLCAFFLSIPAIKLFEMLFEFLQETF